MNRIKQFAAVLTVAMTFAASTFAENRHQNQSRDSRGDRRDDRGRVERRDLSARGHVTNLYRERDGYRVQIDRGSQWYYVPQSAWRNSRGNRNFDLRVGVSINLGGGYYDDRGYISCNDAWVDDGYSYGDSGYRDDYISGTVERVDYRRNVIELRESRSGRYVTVDMRQADRRGRRGRGVDVSDLRRGDYIEVEGQWARGHVFLADRIDGVDSRRGRY